MESTLTGQATDFTCKCFFLALNTLAYFDATFVNWEKKLFNAQDPIQTDDIGNN